ncbi:hypothetical protein ADK64_37160 [Streptomyces sp. MMG1121]|nr:hypothetical protein ADK64_37160 [Streptomyces sp. MMG1121]
MRGFLQAERIDLVEPGVAGAEADVDAPGTVTSLPRTPPDIRASAASSSAVSLHRLAAAWAPV